VIKKNVMLAISLICIIFYVTGCASENEDDIISVVIWHSSNSEQEEALNAIVEAFNQSQENIIVSAINQPSANFVENIYNSVANNVGPDIIFNFATMAADFIPDGKIVNLCRHIDVDWLRDAVNESAFKESTGFVEGQLFVLPLHTSGPVLFINRSIYDELGLDAPTTWDELAENSRVVYEQTGIPGFLADSLVDLVQCLLLQGGSGYIDVENNTVLFNNEIAVSRLQWLRENVENQYFTIEVAGTRAYQDFNAGLVATIMSSVGHIATMDENPFDVEVVPIPQGGAVEWSPMWNRSFIVFSSHEENEEAAIEFLEFFIRPENLSAWAIASGNLSPYFSTLEIEAYEEFVEGNLALSALKESFEFAGYLPPVIGSATVRTELDRAVLLILSGQSTIEDALRDAEITSNAALQENAH